MRAHFVVLDFDTITDESATCRATRRYEPLHDPAGEAGRGAGSHVSARQTLTQYG